MGNTPTPNNEDPNPQDTTVRRDTYIGLGIILVILFFTVIAYTSVGFGPYEGTTSGVRAPTLWDWLELLIVPLVLALGALWFNATQKKTELEIAENACKTDREIAEERQRQTTLEAYYDRITDLLLDKRLRNTEKGAEERSIARARTLAVLRSLDGDRKGQTIEFLFESKLIEASEPVVALYGADLNRADLRVANLNGANLSEARLRSAWLNAADLRGANLRKAKLGGASLLYADLSEADLSEANLSGADLNGANLSGARYWTFEQLEQANQLTAATMTDGVKLIGPENEGPTFQEWKAQNLAKQEAERGQNEACSEPNHAGDG